MRSCFESANCTTLQRLVEAPVQERKDDTSGANCGHHQHLVDAARHEHSHTNWRGEAHHPHISIQLPDLQVRGSTAPAESAHTPQAAARLLSLASSIATRRMMLKRQSRSMNTTDTFAPPICEAGAQKGKRDIRVRFSLRHPEILCTASQGLNRERFGQTPPLSARIAAPRQRYTKVSHCDRCSSQPSNGGRICILSQAPWAQQLATSSAITQAHTSMSFQRWGAMQPQAMSYSSWDLQLSSNSSNGGLAYEDEVSCVTMSVLQSLRAGGEEPVRLRRHKCRLRHTGTRRMKHARPAATPTRLHSAPVTTRLQAYARDTLARELNTRAVADAVLSPCRRSRQLDDCAWRQALTRQQIVQQGNAQGTQSVGCPVDPRKQLRMQQWGKLAVS